MCKVERLTDGDAGRAGPTLAKAFSSDPAAAYMLPDPGDRRRLLPWHFAAPERYGVLFGETNATSGNLLGVAVWLTPGESRTGN